MATLEDLLLLRAQQDVQARENPLDAALMGGSIGALSGAIAGEAHMGVNSVMDRAKDAVMESRGYTPKQPNVVAKALDPVRPRMRMAGGLVGAILGGALGVGAKQVVMQENPAAELLAKLQVDGDLSPADQQALQSVLADTYNSTLGM